MLYVIISTFGSSQSWHLVFFFFLLQFGQIVFVVIVVWELLDYVLNILDIV